MLNLIRGEFYKLRKSISLKICFLLSCICAVAIILVSHFIAIEKMSADVSASASGLTEIVIVSLLGSLMAGILICSDFETKTIHDAVTCGKGRRTVVFSKAIVYVIIIALLLLPYLIATIIGFCTKAQYSSPFVASVFIRILYDGAGIPISPDSIVKIIMISISTMLVHAARLSICIPLAFKIRKPVVILAFGFTFNALIDLILGLFDDIPVISDVISITPFSRNFLMLTMESGAGIIVKAIISSIVFIMIMTIITAQTFQKAEIK